MDEARADLLLPILPSAQQVALSLRLLSMLVIVIADRARQGSARREEVVKSSGLKYPPDINDLAMVEGVSFVASGNSGRLLHIATEDSDVHSCAQGKVLNCPVQAAKSASAWGFCGGCVHCAQEKALLYK